jgi:hypothetical protein
MERAERRTAMISVGVDWAEVHHDAYVMDKAGEVLGKRRIADSIEHVGELNEQVGTDAIARTGPARPGSSISGVPCKRTPSIMVHLQMPNSRATAGRASSPT